MYNVTKYLDDHPGGEEVLLDRAGADATEDYEDVGHSNEARKTLKEFLVGPLEATEEELAEMRASRAAASGGGDGAGLRPR